MSTFGGASLWMCGQPYKEGPFMDFVWQTKEKSIIVIDGGKTTDNDGKATTDGTLLEKYILKNAAGKSFRNGKPFVEAIFVTHAHSDHIDAIVDIIDNYDRNKIEIGNIYANLPSWEAMDEWEGPSPHRENFKRALKTAEKRGVNVVTDLPLGSEINIDELKFRILYVADENIHSAGINDASMVIKVTTPDLSVLFLGDLGWDSGDALLKTRYAEELKSDVVQLAHHGANAAKRNVYEKVGAKIGLWACPDYVWSVHPTHPWLTTLETRQWMEELGCKINYVAKDGDAILK